MQLFQRSHKNLPTKIARRPLRGQLPLSLQGGEGRRERLAAKRRRQRVIASFALSVMVAASVYGVGLISHNERFMIASVDVVGSESLSNNTVKRAFEAHLYDEGYSLFSRTSIFLFPKKKVQEELLVEIPRIASVEISRATLLAQAVTLSIVERRSAHRWCADACYLMDKEGLIFAPAEKDDEIGFEFRGGLLPRDPVGQRYLETRFESAVALMQDISGSGHRPLSLTVVNDSDVHVALEAGYFLKLTYPLDGLAVIRNVGLILASDALAGKKYELEYVDLRFGNRVYYKMRGAPEPETPVESN